MKGIQDWLLSEVGNLIQTKIVVGSLPSTEGISITQTTGAPQAEYRNRSRLNRTVYAVNAKSRSQAQAIEWLDTIHKELTKRIGYVSQDGWQIVTVETSNEPTYLGQEGNETYLYGSSLSVKWYWNNQ